MNQVVALTRPQKAAVMLVAMGKPSASRLLKFFKQEELRTLIEGARLLRTVPQSELERIVAEFEAEFTEGAGLFDSADKIDTILNETLSPEEVQALMAKGGAVKVEEPSVWAELEKIDVERIGHFLAGEHPQTAAMVLAKLVPSTAASVLLTLDKPHRNEIVRRMMALTTMPDTASRILEGQLRSRVLGASTLKDTTAAQARVASVLNEMDKEQVNELLQDLEETGTADLHAVRARLFSFDDIEALSQKARATLFDALSSEVVTLALRAAPPSLVECVLASVSPRSKRMIEAELGNSAEGIPMSDIQGARKTIVSTAIRMAGEGLFELPAAQI